nr:hypothetical protein [Metabacillus lacus]
MDLWILSLFLYFPENKAEYIPAGMTMLLFFIAAILVFRLIINISKKEQEMSDKLEEKLKHSNKS